MSLLTLRGNSAAATAGNAAAAVKPKSELRTNPDFAETEADDLADILQKFIRVAGQVGWPLQTLFASFASRKFASYFMCETFAEQAQINVELSKFEQF